MGHVHARLTPGRRPGVNQETREDRHPGLNRKAEKWNWPSRVAGWWSVLRALTKSGTRTVTVAIYPGDNSQDALSASAHVSVVPCLTNDSILDDCSTGGSTPGPCSPSPARASAGSRGS